MQLEPKHLLSVGGRAASLGKGDILWPVWE